MNRRTKRGLVLGGAALAIVGGGGAALAAGGDLFGSNDRQAFLDDAAARLKVSSSDLQNALSSAFDDRVDAAVKAGKLTQAQGDALKARAKQSGGFPLLGGHGGPGFAPGLAPGFGFGRGPGGLPMTMTAAAAYLGLTEAQLRTQLESGKSLAQVAKAQDKTVAGLKQAMLDAAKKELAADVKAGKLTQAQADAIVAGVSSRLDDQIQNARPQFGGPAVVPGLGFGFGFGFGRGPDGLQMTMSAAAAYLGLTEAQLRTQLESGKSLAQVAKAQDKTVAGLKQAMLDAAKKELAADVKAGKLTQAQADAITAGLSSRLDDQIQNARPQFDGRGGPDGHRFQFRGGGSRFGGSGFPPGQPPQLPPAA